MLERMSGPRGSYAKGIAKREEILVAAVDVVDRVGFRRATIREIAEAVGLSQPGLLHYFGSKEELLTEVLRKRDEINRGKSGYDPEEVIAFETLADRMVDQAVRNTRSRGLVHLFSQLSVDAADEKHPAGEFFRARSGRLHHDLTASIDRAQREGTVTDAVSPEALARLIHSAADGIQLQFLSDPGTDMPATMDALFALIREASATPRPDEAPYSGAPAGTTGTA